MGSKEIPYSNLIQIQSGLGGRVLEKLNIKIIDLQRKLHAKQSVSRNVERTRKDLVRENEYLVELEAKIRKEKEDIRRLEGLTVSSILTTLSGNKKEEIESGKNDLMKAIVLRNQVRQKIQIINVELDGLLTELEKYLDVEENYEKLLNEKEVAILQADDGRTQSLLDISGEMVKIQAEEEELKEGYSLSQEIATKLRELLEALKSIALRFIPVPVNGSILIAPVPFHDKLDEAERLVLQAQIKIDKMSRVLESIKLPEWVESILDNLSDFSFLFSNGFFTVDITPRNINRSTDQVEKTIKKIDGVQIQILKERESLKEQFDSLEEQHRQLLERTD